MRILIALVSLFAFVSSTQAVEPQKVADSPTAFIQKMQRECAANYGDQADTVTYDVELNACELTIIGPVRPMTMLLPVNVEK